MKNENYDVSYFIQKFEAIPEEKWITGHYSNTEKTKFCAYGHCGMTVSAIIQNEEAKSLNSLFLVLPDSPASINDGHTDFYQQPTPKQRILAALYDIKKAQEPKLEKEYVVVLIDKSISIQSKQLVTEN